MHRRISQEELQAELLRRMSEPEPLRTLRRQQERIEAERETAVRKMLVDREADHLRHEIEAAGYRPEA
jgi:hypothetical protein